MTRMPWGKHKGQPLELIPLSYLSWLMDECDLKPGLKASVATEIARRLSPWVPAMTPRSYAPAPRAALREALGRWHREQALRWHPDRPGGDVRVCQAINAAHDELTAILDEGEP